MANTPSDHLRPQAAPTERLAIEAALPALRVALDAAPFAVLVAAPGAGKTTRVPLALLDAGWRGDGRIVMLEPRRLAARAAARRMAATLGEAIGETVGYRVRLESRMTARTRIEVVTEGVFTRMLLDDPELAGIACVIFDEFHERSLEGDLGLALALDATALRPDLRLLVMSATIDAAAVSRLLGNAPVIKSEGRTFPVETRYAPPAPNTALEEAMAATIARAMADDAGSVLAFLPGQAEIRRTAERLAGHVSPDVDIAPLFGDLTPAEQDRAVAPSPPGRRKVVLATAIAETSLTIEGVRIVVDGGLSRRPAYDPGTGLAMLTTRRISRAAADQRRGRAGRIEPGICYRLWSAPQDAALVPFDPPEILEADLAGFALDLASWGVSDPKSLAFLDPPPEAAWTEAIALLRRLEAVDATGRITGEGRALAAMPLHPRLAHMIHRAREEGEAMAAASLAVLLGERGLGGNDVDLDERMRRFRQDRGQRAEEARALARRWAGANGGEAIASHGRHLVRAFPDRVAQAAGRRGRFRLVNGRAASIDESDPLASRPFLVVADVTGSAASGRIRAAAAIERAEIEELLAGQIVDEESLAFDPVTKSVRARRIRRLGEARLAESTAAISDSGEAARLLAAGIAETGIAALPWTREQAALRGRASYLNRTLGLPWPDLSDDALAEGGAGWLAPHIVGRFSLGDITADDLASALAESLPWAMRREMDELLPSHFEAPTGSRLPIDYDAENGPALEIRVQELFGLDRHPSIAAGRVPLLLVLLSPAHRPIQTTRDLPGFWRGSWKDVARDLKGRYPRHPWPDDPLAAVPTNRAKPRGT